MSSEQPGVVAGTVSREYGAGGGEVARRLATALGWDLLDHELLHRAAQLEHLLDLLERSTNGPSAWPIIFGYTHPTSGTSTGSPRRLTRRSRKETSFS